MGDACAEFAEGATHLSVQLYTCLYFYCMIHNEERKAS